MTRSIAVPLPDTVVLTTYGRATDAQIASLHALRAALAESLDAGKDFPDAGELNDKGVPLGDAIIAFLLTTKRNFACKVRNTLVKRKMEMVTPRQVDVLLSMIGEEVSGKRKPFYADSRADFEYAADIASSVPSAVPPAPKASPEGISVASMAAPTKSDETERPVLRHEVETGLDISSIPDGYYAVRLPNTRKTSDITFLRVKRLRANRFRNRRYRYGRVLTGREYVPAGTIEVAELSSNAQRLVGEDRGCSEPGKTYRGPLADHLERVMLNPKRSAMLFAREIGRCGRCGKLLTDPQSRMQCFGPECIGKVNEHFLEEVWTRKYLDRAKTTCPKVGCRSKEGHPIEGEDFMYGCPNGHLWLVK